MQLQGSCVALFSLLGNIDCVHLFLLVKGKGADVAWACQVLCVNIHSLGTSLGTRAQSNAIQHSSSAMKSAFTRL